MNKTIFKLIGLLAFAALISTPLLGYAEEYRKDGWPLPEFTEEGVILTKYTQQRDLLKGCAGNDTYQEVFILNVKQLPHEAIKAYGVEKLDPNDVVVFTVIRSMANHQPIAVFLDRDVKEPSEITIVDREGDGVFRYKYMKDENVEAPLWAEELCAR